MPGKPGGIRGNPLFGAVAVVLRASSSAQALLLPPVTVRSATAAQLIQEGAFAFPL